MKFAKVLLPPALAFTAIAGLACGDAAAPAPRGITGRWVGQGHTCPVTQSVTEATSGAVTGTATTGEPCAVRSYTVTGTNHTGGVTDSTVLIWTEAGGAFQLFLSGRFDGSGTMTGGFIGPDPECDAAGKCSYSLTRTSSTP